MVTVLELWEMICVFISLVSNTLQTDPTFYFSDSVRFIADK